MLAPDTEPIGVKGQAIGTHIIGQGVAHFAGVKHACTRAGDVPAGENMCLAILRADGAVGRGEKLRVIIGGGSVQQRAR